jgi:hypothetical protein
MAVALLYNLTDLTALANAVQLGITAATGADKTQFQRIATAIGTPSAAPIAPVNRQQGDPDTRLITLTYSGVTKSGVTALFAKFAPTIPELRPYNKDAKSSAVDNWTGA